MSNVAKEKYYDAGSDSYKRVKSSRWRDDAGSVWSKKNALKYYDFANSKWIAIETKQPTKLDDDDHETRALWHFDKGSGNTCYDSSGNGLDINRVQYAQQPVWASGYFYKSLYFTDDRINAPDHGSLYDFANGDSWQIDVVFRLLGSAPGENKVFIGYYGGGTNVIWVGTNAGTGKLQFWLRDNAGNNDYIIGTSNVYTGSWIKASFIRTGGVIKIYRNSSLQNSKNDNNTAGYNIPRWNIGWFDAGSFPEYAIDSGYIDEIRIMKGIFITGLT